MSDLFVVHRKEPGEVSPAGDINEAMSRVRQRVSGWWNSEPVVVFERGTKWRAHRKDVQTGVRLLRDRLQSAEPGDVIGIRQRRDTSVQVRKVQESIQLPDQASIWPDEQKDVYTFVFGTFKGVRWGGTCNCRDNRQGTSLSDHACCRALDVFPVTKKQGDDIYRELMERKQEFRIRYIAWQVSLHYDHLHIATGDPCKGCF